jgi:single-stranded-DNA-specific exonuclease
MGEENDFIRTLLETRGITGEEAKSFLDPQYDANLHDPYLMRDMEKACVRIFEAIDRGEKVVIYADYDCDGIPGAVVLEDLFKLVKFVNYEVYIPKRNSEGYGLNLEAINEFKDKGVNLLITIDLGITAVEEVAQAGVHGIDVIITDHHLPIPGEDGPGSFKLPRAYAILNPKVDDYPEKMLCGAGVVFKLAQGFIKKYGEYFKIKNGREKWMLDMAGLATLSDMVPLLGENRVIAYFGMKVLRKSPRPGLQKILKKMNIDQRRLNEDDVGFMLAPRLNAASRMDDPRRAYELLSTQDEAEAGVLAEHLTKINDERKYIVTNIMKDVKKTFEHREVREVLVVGNPSWRVGVLGLVAGKLVDIYERPVFVWGKDENDLIKGSCRSPGTASVVELMAESSEFFTEYGGHEMAGGFTAVTEKIHFLEDNLAGSFHKVKKEMRLSEAKYDVKEDLGVVTMRNWRILEKLAPFGIGNPKPVFLFEGVKVEKIKKFGKNGSGEHLEITVSNGQGKQVKAVSFFTSPDSFGLPIMEGGYINLLGTFDLSYFGRKEELRLRVVDII